MEEQTEWMDEQPDRSPPELPPMSLSELYEYIGSLFQQTVEQVKQAYEPVMRAFSGWGEQIFIVETDGEPGPLTREQLLEMKRRSNHGPRAGAKFSPNGKARW